MGDGGGELEFLPTVDTQITIGLVFPIVLMGWRIQEHQSKDIQVPHPINACEKGTVHLDSDAAPLPMAFCHLANNEENDSHSGAGQGDQHEELEPENQPLIVQPPDFAHGRQAGLLPTDVPKHLKHHEAQKQEVEAEADTSHNDEGHSQLCPDICSPDAVEGICELYPSLTHVKYEETERANSNWSDLLPVPCYVIPLVLILREMEMRNDIGESKAILQVSQSF